MKRFLTYITFFAIAFFIVDKGFCFFVQNAAEKEYDKRLELVLNGQINKDLIIIGSSRGANNIVAEQLEQETNLTCFNLSFRGADIDFQEFVLRTLFKFNEKPKKVLLVIDNPQEFKNVNSLNFRFDRLFPLKKYNDINDELIKRGKKNVLSKFFCLARLNRKDFSLKKMDSSKHYKLTSRGSQLLQTKSKKTLKFNSETPSYLIEDEEQSKLSKFKSIQNLCHKNKVELIYVFSPNFSSFNSAFLNRFKKLVKDKNKILVYDTLNDSYKQQINFSDESHLLGKGAELFTSEISEFIKNNGK